MQASMNVVNGVPMLRLPLRCQHMHLTLHAHRLFKVGITTLIYGEHLASSFLCVVVKVLLQYYHHHPSV